jgi:hypothetical protein
MVNAGFPARNSHGFERVDAPGPYQYGRIGHQSKIYTESNQADFAQIFDDLTSMQTLTFYPALLVVERLPFQSSGNEATAGTRECSFCCA